MAKRMKISSMVAAAAMAGTLLAPSPAGAQTPLCDGKQVTISGTAGDDILVGTSGNDVFFAAQGNDLIWGLDGDDTVCAGQGDDVIVGGQGFDVLFGAQGNDVIFAADGSSVADRTDIKGARMFGGAGNDLIVGSSRWDRMQGGLGVDHLVGYEGQDWMRGGGNADFLDGGANVDDMHGGNGNDRMTTNAGDTVRGSNGNDLCALNGAPKLIVSCTSSPTAFDSARTFPIVPPTEDGANQVVEHVENAWNTRSVSGIEEFFAQCADLVELDYANRVAENNDLYGDLWSSDLRVTGTGFNTGRAAEFSIFENFSTDGGPGTDSEYSLSFIYEDGAWRSNETCF